MKPLIFLSYSHKDVEIMRQVRDSLIARGLDVWTDEFLVPGTAQWETEIAQTIEKSNALIVILSPEAKQSLWVGRELSYAEGHNVRVFPVLALGDEKTAIPFRLTTAQHVDIRNSYASGIEQLTNALFEYLGIELPDRTKGSAYEKDLLLLAKAIHDLKTPLATARGFTELLLMERYGLDESKKQAFLERVGKSLSRIASILDDLSELSRIRRHLLPVPEKPTDLNEIITAIVEEERIPADENNQTILLELQDQLAGIMLAPEQIRRLVLNLFTNAVKYTSPSGEIRLRTYQKDGFVFFAISDNGTGIPESLKPHLFEPFIRGKNSDQISGTGLGLTIVKEIVEVYDGKIDVESEEGEGTTFTISFRAADNPSAQSNPTH